MSIVKDNTNLMPMILRNIPFRTEFLNKLTTPDRIKVSTAIERYSFLSGERLKISGKTYGSKKFQQKDAELVEQMKSIRERVEKINESY